MHDMSTLLKTNNYVMLMCFRISCTLKKRSNCSITDKCTAEKLVQNLTTLFAVIIIIIRPKRSIASSEYWKYSTGQKNSVDNLTRTAITPPKVELIWMKSGAV